MPAPVPFRPSRHIRAILVADWRDAEELARWHMREVLGLRDAELTPPGVDGGIDVVSARALAQVKHYTSPVGSPEVQQHVGASHGTKDALFYALSGYTAAALAYANAVQLGLFTYNIYGDVHATNDHARQLQARNTIISPDASRDTAREQLRQDARSATASFDRELVAAARFSEQFAFARELDREEREDLQRFVLVELMAVLSLIEEIHTVSPRDTVAPQLASEIVGELETDRTWPEWIRDLAVWRHKAHELYALVEARKQRGREATVEDRARVLLADAYRRGHWSTAGEMAPIRISDRWASRVIGNFYQQDRAEQRWFEWVIYGASVEATPEWWRPVAEAHIFGLRDDELAQRYDVEASDYFHGGPWNLV